MIRKLPISKLVPGMYVVDLHKNWLEHNLWLRRFLVRDENHIRTLIEQGIEEVSIDSARGLDLPPPPPSPIVPATLSETTFLSLSERLKLAAQHVSLGEERRRAARLLVEASAMVTGLMQAAQAGLAVDAPRLEPVVAKMIESIRRNPDALVPMARLKKANTYAADHAVATAGLIISLGQQQGLAQPEIEKLALGTMLKDIGQAGMDEKLITKPGMLSKAEYSAVQNHVEEGLAVLGSALPETAAAVILEHHERYNGCGYPYRMAGDEITAAGRMAAIVDTYDAMTSDRPYRPAVSPAQVLRHLFEQGGTQFDPAIVAAFVRTVGIYPVGTLVLLESGHLAVVCEVHADNLLSPVVRVIFHTGRRQYVAPVEVDLARKFGNHYGQIIGSEDYERWGISPLRWQPA